MKKTTLGIIILLAIAMTFLVGCGYDALKNDAKKESIDTTRPPKTKRFHESIQTMFMPPIMATLLRTNRQSLPASKT